MKITIITVGSRGDVLPYLALGMGLRAAGHEVTLATHLEWAGRIAAAGLGFARLEGAPHLFMAEQEGQDWMAGGSRPLAFLRSVLPISQRLLREQLDGAGDVLDGTEALVFTHLAMAGYHLAEKLGLPCCCASLQPVSPTRCFPSPVLPPGVSFGLYNRLSHILVERGYSAIWKGEINRWRQERLGLAPVPPGFSYFKLRGEELPILYGFSEIVIPKPPDWSDRMHVTGYWFLDRPPGWAPPEALVEFLETGPPPVYVGFGSVMIRDAAAMTALVRAATDRAGQRAIISIGRGAGEGVRLSGRVFAIDEVPHDWLFPRTAAVVHHGGAGTTAAGLRAGIPAVVVPVVADQFFWGARVHALGAGPAPVPFTRLSAECLAAAVLEAVADSRIRERAAELGRLIRSEDGVARAVDALGTIFGFRAPFGRAPARSSGLPSQPPDHPSR